MSIGRLIAVCALALASCSSKPPPTNDSSASPPPQVSSPPEIAVADLSLVLSPGEGTAPAECSTPGDAGPRPCGADAEALRGEPFFVTVTVRNEGSLHGTFLERPEGLDHDLQAVGPDGIARPLTRYGQRRIERRAAPAAVRRALAPGETVATTLHATRIVDLSEQGTYRLTVVRATPMGSMRSNELVIDAHLPRGPQ